MNNEFIRMQKLAGLIIENEVSVKNLIPGQKYYLNSEKTMYGTFDQYLHEFGAARFKDIKFMEKPYSGSKMSKASTFKKYDSSAHI